MRICKNVVKVGKTVATKVFQNLMLDVDVKKYVQQQMLLPENQPIAYFECLTSIMKYKDIPQINEQLKNELTIEFSSIFFEIFKNLSLDNVDLATSILTLLLIMSH